jgi:hypothetical protein
MVIAGMVGVLLNNLIYEPLSRRRDTRAHIAGFIGTMMIFDRAYLWDSRI